MAHTERENARVQQGTHQEGRHSEQTGQTNRRSKEGDQKRQRSIRQDGETRNNTGNIGGQGFGQGRGMNAGEGHGASQDDKTQTPPNKPGQYDQRDKDDKGRKRHE